jgi:hypothetical protein
VLSALPDCAAVDAESSDESVDDDSDDDAGEPASGSANATVGMAASATPIDRMTISIPIRPRSFAIAIVRAFLCEQRSPEEAPRPRTADPCELIITSADEGGLGTGYSIFDRLDDVESSNSASTTRGGLARFGL